jgi:hypothetical protein
MSKRKSSKSKARFFGEFLRYKLQSHTMVILNQSVTNWFITDAETVDNTDGLPMCIFQGDTEQSALGYIDLKGLDNLPESEG